jgi:CubicO group peptidase (beta-lactamase class C family)
VHDDLIDAIVRPRLRRLLLTRGVGLVVGVTDGATSHAVAYGGLRDGSDESPSMTTIYEIGSITKIFTSTLLASYVNSGSIAIDDPVAAVFPEVESIPTSITYASLATHTSGLPRLPDNIWVSARLDRADPYAAYSEEALLDYLRTLTADWLDRRAGRVNYSNFGFGLLATAMARCVGEQYDEALARRICGPLGLQDTGIESSGHDPARLAQAHHGRGGRTANWHTAALAGAGGLSSNMRDLLTFLLSILDPSSRLAQAFELTLQTHNENLSRSAWLRMPRWLRMRSDSVLRATSIMPIGVGLGWFIGRLPATGRVAWVHEGATGGYSSFVGLTREPQVAVAVLRNRGLRSREMFWPSYGVSNLGIEVLDSL